MNKTLLVILSFFPILVFGQNGKSISLNGYTDFLEVEENDLLDFKNELTIEFWIRPNCTEGNSIILGKEWCQGNFSYYASVADGNIRWSFQSNGFCNTSNYFDTENSLIQPGVFSHVAIVHSQSNLKIYINGESAQLNTNNGVFNKIYNSDEPLRIGAYKSLDTSISNFYSGLIDEIRFWDIALSEQLILSRYQNNLSGNENNLILYYQFEESETGQELIVPNIAKAHQSQLKAISKGLNVKSPYCISPLELNNRSIISDTTYYICKKDSVQIMINNQLDIKSIEWSTGESSNSIWIDQVGEFWVNLETERCNIIQSNFQVQNSDKIEIFDIEICPDSFYEFNGKHIYPNEVKEFSFPNSLGCDSTIIINGILIETQDILSENYIQSCDNIIVIPTILTELKINSISIDHQIEIFEDGIYFIEGIDGHGCLVKDTLDVQFIKEDIYIPNIINPNSLSNNCFRPFFGNNKRHKYKLKIYDRWGNMIYNYFGDNACWDGTFNSKSVEQGVYTYFINYDSECLKKSNQIGTVTIIK